MFGLALLLFFEHDTRLRKLQKPVRHRNALPSEQQNFANKGFHAVIVKMRSTVGIGCHLVAMKNPGFTTTGKVKIDE